MSNRQASAAQDRVIETKSRAFVSESDADAADARSLRAVQVLEALAARGGGLAPADLARALDIPKPSLSRLLRVLETGGYVVREIGGRGFALSPRIAALALRALRSGSLAWRYRPTLAALVQRLEESCNLTALEEDHVVYVDRVETHHPLRMTLGPGTRVPLHCTASGKLFLAQMDKVERRGLIARLRLDRHTPHTICRADELEREIDRHAARAIGVDNEEFIRGMVAVAVPVLDRRGQCVAAVACHAPTARLRLDDLLANLPALRLAAERIAHELLG